MKEEDRPSLQEIVELSERGALNLTALRPDELGQLLEQHFSIGLAEKGPAKKPTSFDSTRQPPDLRSTTLGSVKKQP